MGAEVDENLLQTRNFSIHWLIYWNKVPSSLRLNVLVMIAVLGLSLIILLNFFNLSQNIIL